MALRRPAAIALAACALAVACTRPAPPAARPLDEPRCLSGAGIPGGRTGVIYAAGGEDPSNAELYEIRLGRRICLRQLTREARISMVTAGDGMLITSNARGIIGDRIELFREGRFQAVPHLGRPYAFTPSLSPDGRTLAFVRPSGPGNRVKTIVALDLDTGERERLFRATRYRESPGALAWGPDGRSLATPLGQRGPRRVLLVMLDGSTRVIAESWWTSMAVWFPSPLIAVSAPTAFREGSTLLLRPDGTKVGEIPEWSAIAWSPDGRLLLLERRDGTLGFATGPRWRPRILGFLPVPIYSTSRWLEEPIPGVLPQPDLGPTPGSA